MSNDDSAADLSDDAGQEGQGEAATSKRLTVKSVQRRAARIEQMTDRGAARRARSKLWKTVLTSIATDKPKNASRLAAAAVVVQLPEAAAAAGAQPQE